MWTISLLLRPIVTFVFLLILGYTVVYPIRRFMKDGKLKRLLLTDVSGDANGRRWKEFRAKQKARKDSIPHRP